MSKIQVFDYSAKNFPLDSHQSCSICLLELLSDKCTIWVSKAQFLSHLGPQSKSKFLSLITFSKRFHWFHFSMASHAHCKYFKMCGEYGPQRLFGPRNFGIFSGLWSFSQNCFTGFVSVFGNRPIGAIFRGMLNIGLRGPISGSFWAPKQMIIQVFSHFLKYFLLVSHHSCFTCVLGYIIMRCPTGSIFGPSVKVVAGLVRPSGLMFTIFILILP